MGKILKNNDVETMINDSYADVERILSISKFDEYDIQPSKVTKNSKKKPTEKLFLFVSFDLCNSTQLKVDEENWFKIIEILLNQKFQAMNFWKFNGDEIIFRAEVNSLDYICGIIERTYKRLQELQIQMRSIRSGVNIKATIWIAKADSDLNRKSDNCKFDFNGIVEFVGKNIDEGFRLTKCSAAQKIVVDPKIIYLFLEAAIIHKAGVSVVEKNSSFNKSVLKNTNNTIDIINKINEILNKIHYIGSAICKGVWDEMPYPIYWYYNENTYGIKYDEFFNGEHIWSKSFENLDSNYYFKIKEIFETVNRQDEYFEIRKLIQLEGSITQTIENQPNLYYMVACVNPVSHKVMVAHRSKTRQHLRHVWDFGNVKYQNVNVVSTICQEYKNTFGIDIELITDPIRKGIKTFGYCTIYRNCRPHNSLLCYAIIKNEDNYSDEQLTQQINEHLKKVNKNKRYEEVRFVSDKEVNYTPLTIDEIRSDSEMDADKSNLGEDRCIMYFKDSIKDAIKESKKRDRRKKSDG